MKKLVLSAVVAAALLTACSKDDEKKCESCTSDLGNKFESSTGTSPFIRGPISSTKTQNPLVKTKPLTQKKEQSGHKSEFQEKLRIFKSKSPLVKTKPLTITKEQSGHASTFQEKLRIFKASKAMREQQFQEKNSKEELLSQQEVRSGPERLLYGLEQGQVTPKFRKKT